MLAQKNGNFFWGGVIFEIDTFFCTIEQLCLPSFFFALFCPKTNSHACQHKFLNPIFTSNTFRNMRNAKQCKLFFKSF